MSHSVHFGRGYRRHSAHIVLVLAVAGLIPASCIRLYENTTAAAQHIVVYSLANREDDFRTIELMGITPFDNRVLKPCEAYPECSLEYNAHADIRNADVVLFPWKSEFWREAPIPELRAGQTSVLYQREAIPIVPEAVKRAMHVHMGFRYYDDILNPRFLFTRSELKFCTQGRSWVNRPVQERTRFAMAITSHCDDKRMAFLEGLKAHIPLDIYGKCTGLLLPEPPKRERVDLYQLASEYKFFVAVENNIEPGYISEKLMLGLRFGLVPVYLGDPGIEAIMHTVSTHTWFINAAAFKTVKKLGSYLVRINGTAEYERLVNGWRTEINDARFTGHSRDPRFCEELMGPASVSYRSEEFCQLCDKERVHKLRRALPHVARLKNFSIIDG